MSGSWSCWRMTTCCLHQALPRSCQRSKLPILTHFSRYQRYATSTENLPRVAQPSIWHSIIPKAFRQSDRSHVPANNQRSKEWNPATFFIWIFLLIGSNGIQMLTLRNEYSTFSRKADQKIALLKEVLDKVQRGENVDVEKVLGTGDEEQEQEWKDVIKDIEQEDLWASKDRRREKRRLKKEEAKSRKSETPAQESDNTDLEELNPSPDRTNKPPKFY